MKIRLNRIKVIDPLSPWNRKYKDLIIAEGKIFDAALSDLTPDRIIEAQGMEIMPGFCETYANIGDPGHEYREDFESVAAAAAAGGVTAVCAIADNDPVTQHKTHIEYLKKKTTGMPVEIWPIGAVTENLQGKNPTEMYDMHYSGAVAFSDAPHPVSNAGVMLRALQYLQPIDSVVIAVPYNQALSEDGQVNEGPVSVRLGMKGLPPLAESLQIHRDLELLKYGGGRLHFTGISTAEAVQQIRTAKEQGLNVTASVYLHHLFFDETATETFDTNFKVMPPLRTAIDISALMAGVEDGTIDCISTQHVPLDTEVKRLEFEYALPGMANLELAFPLANTIIGERIGLDRVVELFAHQPRKILRKPLYIINEGASANFVLTDASESFVAGKNKHSKSQNNSFEGQTLRGKVKAIFNNGEWIWNERL
jgi:dihydroorotase